MVQEPPIRRQCRKEGGKMEVRHPYFSGEDSLASNKVGAFLP